MVIVAVACVKNEIDIIEPFVRHTLARVDHLLVLDNGSTDGTLAVLEALRCDGLPLEIVEDASSGKYQAQRQTRLMQRAASHYQADWVVLLDADEFLVVRGSRLVPAEADPSKPWLMPWQNYVPHPSDDPAQTNVVSRVRHRWPHQGQAHSKVIIPRAIALRPDARTKHGNHGVFLGDVECPATWADEVHLAHFPIRSPGQYLTKVALNHLQYLTMPERAWDWGWHYRELFPQLLQDPLGFAADYREALGRYQVPIRPVSRATLVLDPIEYRGGPLRYTPRLDDKSRALQAVLAFSADLANRFAALGAGLDEEGHIALARHAATVASLHEAVGQQYEQHEKLRRTHEDALKLLAQANDENASLRYRLSSKSHRSPLVARWRKLRAWVKQTGARLGLDLRSRRRGRPPRTPVK